MTNQIALYRPDGVRVWRWQLPLTENAANSAYGTMVRAFRDGSISHNELMMLGEHVLADRHKAQIGERLWH